LYVLPSTDQAREDFAWVREEVLASGGQVSIFEAAAVDGHTDAELVQQFRNLRTAEYEALAAEIRKARVRTTRSKRRQSPADRQRSLQVFHERWHAIEARDYFGAAGRALVEQALKDSAEQGRPEAGSGRTTRLQGADFRRRTWVTRSRPGVDRFACSWLIRRFIAPDAKFAFVNDPTGVRDGQVPFDIADVEFGHHGSHCSVETLIARFGIKDRAVLAVSRVVHDLDLKDARYGMPEGPAVGRLVDGLRASYGDDAQLLEQGVVLMEALYRSFSSESRGRKKGTRR